MFKKENVFKFIVTLTILFCIFSLGLFSSTLFKLNVIPSKYLVLVYVCLLLFLSALSVGAYKFKKDILKIFMIILLCIVTGGLFFANSYIKETYEFLESLRAEKYGYLSYSVVVLKNSPYKDVTDLSGKNVAYLDDYIDDIKKNLSFNYEEMIVENFGELTSALTDKDVDAIVIESASFDIAKTSIEDFEKNTQVIYTFEIKILNEIPKDDDSVKEEVPDVLSEPFIVYISGIDQYGSVKSVRGRSDVNQLAVVNPKTNKVLLVNTPRDYYVQLHGKTGLKDKLTHAGIYGIDMSIKTLEDLYDVDIDYYLRVNFNTLINVVDEIGGIDVYSDKAFTAYTNGKVHVKKGMNHFDGKAALAYSRERYAYATGDRHRGENQQQVISAIIDKVTTSEVLIKNYNNILNSLSKTFQTNMEVETITSFLRYQLDKMPKWQVETTAVTGSDSRNYTYSMGTKYLLYVMEPNLDSLNAAKNKIAEVLNEN